MSEMFPKTWKNPEISTPVNTGHPTSLTVIMFSFTGVGENIIYFKIRSENFLSFSSTKVSESQ